MFCLFYMFCNEFTYLTYWMSYYAIMHIIYICSDKKHVYLRPPSFDSQGQGNPIKKLMIWRLSMIRKKIIARKSYILHIIVILNIMMFCTFTLLCAGMSCQLNNRSMFPQLQTYSEFEWLALFSQLKAFN